MLAKIKYNINALRKLLLRRAYISKATEKSVIENFHRLFYDSGEFGGTWENTYWMGYPTRKCPFDFWIYQEILFEIKPDVIIECGTSRGGSALWLAHICDIIQKGKVITIDIEKRNNLPVHNRIEYVIGSSVDNDIVDKIKSKIKPSDIVLVIRDSDHHKPHVYEELKIYSKMVTAGSYLIVEDSNLNGHPVAPDFGPGPQEALQEFLKTNNDFIIDKNREKFLVTFNPNGYLKKIKAS